MWCDHKELDVLIAVNAESVRLHASDIKKDGVVFVEEAYHNDVKDLAGNIIPLPMAAFATEAKAKPVARTTVALGALCYIAGLQNDKAGDLVREAFSDIGSEINMTLAGKGYAYAEEKKIAKMANGFDNTPRADKAELLDGNRAVGKGLFASGLTLYIAYPMTPSTSILHYLAKEGAAREDLKTIQPEDEISAINMAIGAAYAGKRSAVGTATGGFALMQEAFSFAGVSETPLVVAVSQRQGPATGVPTATSQGDLLFVLHSGHGEFPRLVIAPGDPEEAYYASANAMELAWKYQIPAIVLLDKQLSECTQTSIISTDQIIRCQPKMHDNNINTGEYKRYQYQDDGVSHLAFPGTPNAAIKLTSYEHDESGVGNDIPQTVQAMHEKRAKKMEKLSSDLSKYDTIKVSGNSGSDTVVLFWGSTKGAVLEASKSFTKMPKLVQVLWMSPLDTTRLSAELKSAKTIISVEASSESQLSSLVREKLGIQTDHKIIQHDSRPFDPEELATAINSLIK
jgi:2-oxoglutarate ferredoxin oxidoreductase subunit alpha